MISIEEFTVQLEAELEGMEKGTLQPDTKYHELDNWSSMYALFVIAYVDSCFDVQLNANDLKNTSTVRQLYEIVASRIKK
jgi:acyl carrier protein